VSQYASAPTRMQQPGTAKLLPGRGALGRSYWRNALASRAVLVPLIPALIFFTAFLVVPLAITLWLSLAPSVLIQQGVSGLGLGNYVYYFQTGFYVEALVRTVLISLATMFCSLLVGYPTAYILRGVSNRVGSTLLLALTFPILAGPIVVVIGWMVLLSSGGPLSQLLFLLRLVKAPPNFIGTELAVTISLIQFTVPFVVLNIFNSLARIDPVLKLAAESLGANPWRAFWEVTWPMSLPGVLSASLISFSLAMSAFVAPHYLGGDARLEATTLIYQFMLGTFNWQMASTVAVLLVAVSLGILFAQDRIVSKAIR
jgi:putative spermidine/putrescine transport system permease protein